MSRDDRRVSSYDGMSVSMRCRVVDRVVDELDEMIDEEVELESPVRGDGSQRSAVVSLAGN